MRKQIPTQLVVGLAILVIGGGIVWGEYFLMKWYPSHQEVVKKETLLLLPYKNDSLGIEMQVAAGFYEKVEPFAGGVRIVAPRFWSIGPSVRLTSQPNPDQSTEFTPQVLAKWQTLGVTEEIPRYHFERTRLNNRDAVLIWQYKDRAMALTARIISPDRIVQADCTPGRADEDLYMQACDESLRTIKVAGPESPPPLTPG
ncbi:MAG: hypothetical protein ABSA41_22170, partial [Terriglobia bacterium]